MSASAEKVLKLVPLSELHESPLNVRRHFDDIAMAELTASVMTHGVLTPLLVRPNATGYEIGAGHRRFRAAKQANLSVVPVLVRSMDDSAFMELLIVDNLQRQDMSPLEEAEGFKSLMTFGFDLDRLTSRINRTRRYVYDRVKLLELIAPAVELLRRGVLPTRHAELLARLTPDQQKAAIAIKTPVNGFGSIEGPLFVQDDRSLLLDAEDKEHEARRKADPYHGMKARSVAELEAWIAEHCRFKPDDPLSVELFPQTVTALEQADTVIAITRNHFVHPDAKEDRARVFGPQSWKRADGREGSKVCTHSVAGYVAVGPGRGQAFKVCADKDACDVHWGKERREKTKSAKSPAVKAKQATAAAKASAREAEQQTKDQAEREVWSRAMPAIAEAVAKKVRSSLPIKAVLEQVLKDDSTYQYFGDQIRTLMPGVMGAELAVRQLFLSRLLDDMDAHNRKEFTAMATKLLKLDVMAIVKLAAAAPAPAKKAKKR